MENLQAHSIPLTGKHLIEASAGTGKTYNITRIYLRMVLERKLPVEQILVMTFTKDATEEIKGRIDDFIRQAMNNWHELVASDPYFSRLASRISYDEAMPLLRRALLFLDEAAIFTIHGFCKRVLSQHAFASGVSFHAKMETDCQDIILQACQDWYRSLAKAEPEQYLLLAQFWQSPESFLTDFNKAIGRDTQLSKRSVDDIQNAFIALVVQAKQNLIDAQDFLAQTLIAPKKGAEQEKRQQEYQQLVAWLAGIEENFSHAFSAMPAAFIDGKRFARSKDKSQLLEIFSPTKEVKTQVAKLAKSIEKAKAFSVVQLGIEAIRTKVKESKLQQGVLSFDDLIATLATRLADERQLNDIDDVQMGLAQRLFEQYPVALVDEFQDTDPLQFTILQAIYQTQTQSALFMIGDPKQAIYGFRGGDVFAYLAARDNCDHQWLMATNWRSSTNMIQAYNRIFYGNNLAEQPLPVFGYGIDYQPVNASPVAKERCFDSRANDDQQNNKNAALQFIHFTNENENKSVAQSHRPVMANWCASEIAELLSPANSDMPQGLQAQDIAILVRDGSEAASIKTALVEHNIPAVFLSNRANLFHSEQARQLLAVLKAILFVENDRYFLAGITTDILAYTPQKLFQLQNDDLAWQALKTQFTQLREHWQYKGFISMALKLMHECFVIDQLANDNAEELDRGDASDQENSQAGIAPTENNTDRALTNFLHLFELLQTASQRHYQAQALLFWFEQQIQSENSAAEAELRLESDDNLIRIVTQHGCKGLEYPVVFVPFATRYKSPLKFGNRSVNLIEYHDNDKQLVMSLDADEAAKNAMAEEAYAESIRLLYVAITRAEQRCYILTTEFENFHLSPLGQTLKWQKQHNIVESLNTLVNDCPTSISVQQVNSEQISSIAHLSSNSAVSPILPQFTSKIERDWWLSSFSALTRNLPHGGLSAPDRDNDLLNPINDSLAEQQSSLMRFQLTKGARTGNLLHEILEHCDFANPDWQLAMQRPLTKFGETGFSQAELTHWLSEIVEAPLVQGGRLADLSWQQTLRESEFYFPMENASMQGLRKILAEHRQVSINQVHLPPFKQLKGMMHGFIDLIFEHQGQYYVCDYKSSHLGDGFSCYQQSQMRTNIESNYYDLQYLIYALALHRQLKFSLPNYSVAEHFGGIYYCYLRGMKNTDEGTFNGVYHRIIRADELQQLDQLFAQSEVTIDE
ncbi:exodeoxyribonuclease V subunit beta [Thalassotalea sp. PLHSN55]|uniref:exodeoxyribonuclease V subunit beta n=1 Tax=Thalassotalea sp. PLHSN55 TaxID=3435888 RepID=UPI003F86F843